MVREFIDSATNSLCVVDINMESMKVAARFQLQAVVGDGCRLPFKDNSFDIVISVDSLEHVPGPKKPEYCLELKRVAKNYIIIHCPADSLDSKFQGTISDTRYLNWYRKHFNKDDYNTVEHLQYGLLKVEQLTKYFPGATIEGKQNTESWFWYMTLGLIPYLRFANGLFYKLYLQKKYKQPPYHACLLTWRKR